MRRPEQFDFGSPVVRIVGAAARPKAAVARTSLAPSLAGAGDKAAGPEPFSDTRLTTRLRAAVLALCSTCVGYVPQLKVWVIPAAGCTEIRVHESASEIMSGLLSSVKAF